MNAANNTTEFLTDNFKLFADGFAKTSQANAKFFDESAKFWTDNTKNGLSTFRSEWDKAADEFSPASRKNVERFHKLFDEQIDRNMAVAKKAFDFKPTTNPTDAFEQISTVTRFGFETARESMDAFVKAGNDIFQAWSEAGRRQVISGVQAATQTVDAVKRPNQK